MLWRPFKSSTTQRRSQLQHGYCIGVSRRSAQATAGKGFAQGSYMAARAGVEPTTLLLRVIASTNVPPCPTDDSMAAMIASWKDNVIEFALFVIATYTKYRFETSVSTAAPRNTLFTYQKREVRKAVTTAFNRYLWYMSELLVGFGLFDG